MRVRAYITITPIPASPRASPCAHRVSQNIDFTTLTEDEINTILLNAPVATYTWDGPYQLESKLVRIGNIVIYNMNSVAPATEPDASGVSDETLPEGWRPTVQSCTACYWGGVCGRWSITTAGQASWFFSSTQGTQRFNCNLTYYTTDPWPTETD